MSELSTYLYARPSFLEGMGRLVDFAGTLSEYNHSSSARKADAIALWSDWTVVGNDMRTAWLDQLIEAEHSEQWLTAFLDHLREAEHSEQLRNVKKLQKAEEQA